jgi:hypothetical protein
VPTLRTTFDGKEIEVSEQEATDLRRLGVVLETKATTDEGAHKAAERKSATTENEG